MLKNNRVFWANSIRLAGLLGIVVILAAVFPSLALADDSEITSGTTGNASSGAGSAATAVVSNVLSDKESQLKEGNPVGDEKDPRKEREGAEQLVDPTGAFQYQIPLDLPEGTNGIAPALTIAYHSHLGNGMLGMGWYLQGLPEIRRDFNYSVNYDTSDHFTYNGEKLVYGSDGYYHVWKENYERIQYRASEDYWVVSKKDGTKLFFGYQTTEHSSSAAGGRIQAANESGKILVWSLSKVLDIHGNYYLVEYNQDTGNGDYYPVRITYTKNGQKPLKSLRTVEFAYELRDDHYPTYNPHKPDMDHRLKWITVKMGGNLLRKWRLDYKYGMTGRSHLVQVQEYGDDGDTPSGWEVDASYAGTGTTLPPLVLGWEAAKSSYQFNAANWGSEDGLDQPYLYGSFTGDYNGDGKTDIALIQTNGAYSSVNKSSSATITCLVAQTTAFLITTPTEVDWRFDVIWQKCRWLSGDFNGDGKTELVRTFREDDGTASADLFVFNGSQFVKQSWFSHQGAWNCAREPECLAGDFDGNGQTDLAFKHYTGTITVYLATGSGTQLGVQSWEQQVPIDCEYDEPWWTGDFNGDGRTDLVFGSHDRKLALDVCLSTGTQFTVERWTIGQEYEHDDGEAIPVVGDFNGDGKADLLNIDGAVTEKAFVYLSTGAGFVTQHWATEENDDSLRHRLTGDFNGDGKSDVLVTHYCSKVIKMYVSTGTQFTIQNWGDYYNNTLDIYNVGDWNGDGKTDLLTFWNGLNVYLSNISGDLVTSVARGKNVFLQISHTPAPQVSGAVVSTGKTYPNIANSSPTPLVTELAWMGFYYQINDYYNYKNGMVRIGLPYEQLNLGYTKIRRSNIFAKVIDTYYNQSDPDLRLMVDKEISYESYNWDPLQIGGPDREKYFSYQNESSSYDSSIRIINLTQEKLIVYDGITTSDLYSGYVHVDYLRLWQYDQYGNVILDYDHGCEELDGDERQTVTKYNYYIDSNTYLVVPALEQKYGCNSKSGELSLAGETRYYYNSDYTLGRRELENDDRDVVVKYEYDLYGNVTAMTDGNNNTITYSYDEDYQTFLRYQTLKFTTEIQYDDLMRPVKQIDANEQVWETTYDIFSREKLQIAPGDSVAEPTIRITHQDEFTDSAGNELYPFCRKTEKKLVDGNYFELFTYYDTQNRMVQEKSEANGIANWIKIDHLYGPTGRETNTYLPQSTTTSSFTIPYETLSIGRQYDLLGRLVQIQKPDGTKNRYFYKIFNESSPIGYDNITVDELGHVTTRRAVGVDYQEYDLKYTGTYSSQVEYSKSSKVTAYDSVTTTDATGKAQFVDTLDMLGRKIKSSNPVGGVWSYSYDSNNNITSWTDAKNQTVRLEYDCLNRITKKTYPDNSTVKYYYDEDGYGYAKGRLTRVEYPGGAESYTYDARGRKTAVTQTIAGKSRTKQMTYNSMDQLTSQIYPDGEVVSYSYDNGGQLTGLQGAAAYLKNMEYYATGKISQMVFGNGVETDYDYYDAAKETDLATGIAYSYRLRRIHAFKDSDLLDLNYGYDQAGNVALKRDLLNDQYTEIYAYDDLNRLTGATSTSYGSKTFRYDLINNITQKDSRNYQYDATNPYRLLNDGRYDYTYDANGSISGRSDGRTIDWDYENRVGGISNGSTYKYNADGRRIGKVEGATETYYFFDDYEETYQAGVKTKSVKYYFANKMRIAENSSADGIRYYHQDHLGSSTAITDANGKLVLHANYAPYGEDAASEGAATVPYKFTGKEKDNTDLYYYGARFYDPVMGRFISVDPARDGDNWYGYCNGNPVKFIDPTGMWTSNSDGTFVAESGDTLWGLQEQTGVDWHSFNYQGDPHNLQIGQSVGISVNNNNSSVTIDSNGAAIAHYYNGKGTSVNLGSKTIDLLKNNPDQKAHETRIINGKTSSLSGNYGVNMTGSMFHVGNTVVEYRTTCGTEFGVTTFTGFVSDGFWDVLPGKGDRLGPKCELGGTPYAYNTYSWVIVYPNPYLGSK